MTGHRRRCGTAALKAVISAAETTDWIGHGATMGERRLSWVKLGREQMQI